MLVVMVSIDQLFINTPPFWYIICLYIIDKTDYILTTQKILVAVHSNCGHLSPISITPVVVHWNPSSLVWSRNWMYMCMFLYSNWPYTSHTKQTTAYCPNIYILCPPPSDLLPHSMDSLSDYLLKGQLLAWTRTLIPTLTLEVHHNTIHIT